VEALVAIGILAILIGLLIPVLSSAKESAAEVVGLSNLRQTGAAWQLYTDEYGGSMPWAPEGSAFRLSPELPPRSVIQPGYWGLSHYWSSLFHEVAPWPKWFEIWTFPDPRRPDYQPWAIDEGSESPFSDGVTSLVYSRALFARPEIWATGDLITDRDSVLRAVRKSEVRFPSSKVSLYDGEYCVRTRCEDPLRVNRAMLFVDGHAAAHALGDAIEPAPPRLEYFEGQARPVLDTTGGAYGRDY